MSPRLLAYRRPFVVALHLVVVAVSNYLSFWLRFDGNLPQSQIDLYVQTLPWLLAVRGLIFVPTRLYRGLWRYTGIFDLRDIAVGVAASSLAFYVLMHWVLGLFVYPRSVFIIDSLVLIFLL